ncbi:uncharacterized protein V1513DRAFT_434717 [Lipomyces chichibuensis]|uniref:uncharacterized protein n=1 Tax=Lipomyces chichibuensis TaxID=1546026 RepID=UPI00334330B5
MTTSQPSPPFSSSVAISAAHPRYIDELRRIGSEYDALARYISTTKLHRSTRADKPTKILSPIQDGIQEYWVQAKVAPDANIFVNVGLGVYLEMPVDEAEQFVENVVLRINHRIGHLTQT